MGALSPLTLLFLFLSLSLLPLGELDLASDRAALLAFRSAVGGRLLLWNISQSTPCLWFGVQCRNDRVNGLRLPGDGLSGEIPLGSLGNLTNLRTLSLRFNALTAQLPPDLASCTGLRNLYLQGNFFSGEIPDFLFGLRSLTRLDLSRNNFSGEISPSFNNLTRLRILNLENNKLTGSIPELKAPKLDSFNVSFNRLNGSIPLSLRDKPATAFEGNSLCGEPLQSCPPNPRPTARPKPVPGAGDSNSTQVTNDKKKKLSKGAIAGIVIGSVFGFILIVLIVCALCRKKTSGKTRSLDISPVKQPDVGISGEKPIGGGRNGEPRSGVYPVAGTAMAASAKGEINNSGSQKLMFFGNVSKVFDLEDLLRASAEVLGKGTFGTTYKAVLEVGTIVAVKRLKDVTISEMEFKEKIEAIGTMDHGNLVPLRAYYYSKDEKLLVYDYMPMGSLSALLHGNRGGGRTPLNWETRSGIALGAARGIEYLHLQGPNASHGNIKSSNVLLTRSYEARISDFGLAHLVGLSSTPNRVSGYRAPEVTDSRKVSQKADVYSFGVLLLELLTGKAPSHAILNEEGVDLPRWVQSVVQDEWTSEVFDLELLRYQNVEEEMVQLLQLAMDCAAQYPDKRPNMSVVTRRIEELRRSSFSHQDHEPQPELVDDVDDGSSRRTNSVGSGPPPSSFRD